MKKLNLLFFVTLVAFSVLVISCTDYEQKFDDEYSYLTNPDPVNPDIPEVNPNEDDDVKPADRNDDKPDLPIPEDVSSSSFKKSASSSAKSSSSKAKSSSSMSRIPMGYRPFDDTRDNHEYHFVVIGEQRWMAENLQWIPEDARKEKKSIVAKGIKAYYPGDNKDNVDEYGLLYTWASAVDSAKLFSDKAAGCGYGEQCDNLERIRGICPEGWHIPTVDEWYTLMRTVGGASTAAKMLKSTDYWNASAAGIYKQGFQAIPSGWANVSYEDLGAGFGESVYFLTSTDVSPYEFNTVRIGSGSDITISPKSKANAFAVRCVGGGDDTESSEKDNSGDDDKKDSVDIDNRVSDEPLEFGTWNPSEKVQVPTGNDNGGWWYEYNDGLSRIKWPVKKGTDDDPESLYPIIEQCEGIRGDVYLEYIDEETLPYVGFGYNFGHQDSLYNITDNKGICVFYYSDIPFKLIIDLDEQMNVKLNYANPRVDLKKSQLATLANFKWSDFKMAEWYDGEDSVMDFFKMARGIKFEFSQKVEKEGLSGGFRITKVGPYGTCEPTRK